MEYSGGQYNNRDGTTTPHPASHQNFLFIITLMGIATAICIYTHTLVHDTLYYITMAIAYEWFRPQIIIQSSYTR